MRLLPLCCLVLSCLAAKPSLAHDPLPIAWCESPTETPVSIGTFQLDQTQLNKALRTATMSVECNANEPQLGGKAIPGTQPGSEAAYPEPLDSCGGVLNPEWVAATKLARARCQAMSQTMGLTRIGIPFVNSPATYSQQQSGNGSGSDAGNQASHHVAYKFTDGDLQGICSVCVPNVQQPPGGPSSGN